MLGLRLRVVVRRDLRRAAMGHAPDRWSGRIAMAAPHHVENPFEYAVEKFAWALRDFARFMIPHPERHAGKVAPQVRRLEAEDLGEALRRGIADVGAFRDDVLFMGVIYPVAG